MPNQNEQDRNIFNRTFRTMKAERDGVDPQALVRETEDASLQDKEYSFDEDNTDTEEYHDADDDMVEDIFDNEEDLQ